MVLSASVVTVSKSKIIIFFKCVNWYKAEIKQNINIQLKTKYNTRLLYYNSIEYNTILNIVLLLAE